MSYNNNHRSSIDLTEDWPKRTVQPRGSFRGIVDHTQTSGPEGDDSGLQGPAAFRRDLLEGERSMKERELKSSRAAAISSVSWARERFAAAEARAEAAEHKLAHDLNPLGRSARHAQWRLEAAQARRDMSILAEDAAEAVDRAQALGVTVAELR